MKPEAIAAALTLAMFALLALLLAAWWQHTAFERNCIVRGGHITQRDRFATVCVKGPLP